jgi:hypothetical protein
MMADEIKKVERFSVMAEARPGQGAKLMTALADGKAGLIAMWAYPFGEQRKIEVVPEDSVAFKAACKAAKIKVKRESAAFCVVGRNKVGALLPTLAKLAEAGITIHAAQAISVGAKFGTLIEVDSKSTRKAAKALGV